MTDGLVEIVHRSGEHFKVLQSDLDEAKDGGDLIPLYELNGDKRSRADAWLGSGRPSDIRRSEAISGVVKTFGDRIREVCADADKDGASRVQYVQDFMAEKDSPCNREYAERLIRVHVKPDAEKLELVKGQLDCDPAEFQE